MTAPVEGQLGILESAGLIELLETDPELEYLFRHVLVQDAAYDSLLRGDRRRLHRLVGETLEERYANRRDELAPVLALHFEQAGEDARAMEYLVTAGQAAMQRFAMTEARGFLARAMALLPRASGDPALARRRVEVGLLRAEASLSFLPTDDVLAFLDDLREDGETVGDAFLLASINVLDATARVLRFEQPEQSAALRRALDESIRYGNESGDPVTVAHAKALLGEVKFRVSAWNESVIAFEEALPVLEGAGELGIAGHRGGTLAVAHAQLGNFERAHAWIEHSDDLAHRSGDPLAIADIGIGRAMIAALEGNARSAIQYASVAADQADAVQNYACAIMARQVVGEQCLQLGEASTAVPVLRRAGELAAESGTAPEFTAYASVLLGSAQAREANEAPGLDRYEPVLALVREAGDRLREAELLRQRARDRVAGGAPAADADADYRAAEEALESLGARAALAQTLQEHGRVLDEAGRREDAAGVLARADALFAEMGLPRENSSGREAPTG